MRVRLGAPLCFKFCKSCSSLWRLLTLLAPPPWFSSATEGLMTATQSGATSRQLQFLQGRGGGGEVDGVCCQHLVPLQWSGSKVLGSCL